MDTALKDRRLAQRRIVDRTHAGKIERPASCSQCEEVGQVIPHIPDGEFGEIDWRCRKCYRLVVPWRTPRSPRQIIRSCPPWKEMRRDWVDRGLTLTEMAQSYGVAKSTVEKTLRRRALSHGEQWPVRRDLSRTVNPIAMAELVREHIREHYNDKSIVRVAIEAADAWAPHSRVSFRHNNGTLTREVRTSFRRSDPPKYHDLACGRLIRNGRAVPTFLIDAIEGEWWGYRPCGKCRGTLQATAFARRHGFERQWTLRLIGDRLPAIPTPLARRLLMAIGEPVPDWMYGPVLDETPEAA